MSHTHENQGRSCGITEEICNVNQATSKNVCKKIVVDGGKEYVNRLHDLETKVM